MPLMAVSCVCVCCVADELSCFTVPPCFPHNDPICVCCLAAAVPPRLFKNVGEHPVTEALLSLEELAIPLSNPLLQNASNDIPDSEKEHAQALEDKTLMPSPLRRNEEQFDKLVTSPVAPLDLSASAAASAMPASPMLNGRGVVEDTVETFDVVVTAPVEIPFAVSDTGVCPPQFGMGLAVSMCFSLMPRRCGGPDCWLGWGGPLSDAPGACIAVNVAVCAGVASAIGASELLVP